MKNKELREKLKRLRTQAMYQVIIMISSLILVFLWFTYFSWTLNQETFSREATRYIGESAEMEASTIVPMTLIIAIFFTIFYIILLITFAPTIMKKTC